MRRECDMRALVFGVMGGVYDEGEGDGGAQVLVDGGGEMSQRSDDDNYDELLARACMVWAGFEDVPRYVPPGEDRTGHRLDKFPSAVVNVVELRAMGRELGRDMGPLAWLDVPGAFAALVDPAAKFDVPGPKSAITEAMVAQCVEAGVAVVKRRSDEVGAVLKLFDVPKSSPEVRRLIVDGRPVNTAQGDAPTFRLPTPRSLAEMLLLSGARAAVKVDFAGYFHQFPMDPAAQSFFTFRVGQRWYRWCRMPMGWNRAPLIAQLSSEVLLGDLLGREGAAWIDDLVVCGSDGGDVKGKLGYLLGRVDRAGVEVNQRKSRMEPAARLEYAGIEWDLEAGKMRLPGEWRVKTVAVVAALRAETRPTLRKVWGVVGKVVWITYALEVRLCRMAGLVDWVRVQAAKLSRGALAWDGAVTVSDAFWSDVAWLEKWYVQSDAWHVPRPLAPEMWDAAVWTDASEQGWGVVWQSGGGKRAWEEWGEWARREHIFVLELRAAERGVKAALAAGARSVALFVDNAAVQGVLARGHSAHRLANEILVRLFDELERKGAVLVTTWIPTDTMPADDPSRRGGEGRRQVECPGVGVVPCRGGFRLSEKPRL